MRYRDRNATERVLCRLNDFRRIATRYDKLATNFLDAIHLVAAVLVVSRNPNEALIFASAPSVLSSPQPAAPRPALLLPR